MICHAAALLDPNSELVETCKYSDQNNTKLLNTLQRESVILEHLEF
jgi:hypothetical protein